MRIDEFSNARNINGIIHKKEERRFLLFGFDMILSSFYREIILLNSPIYLKTTVRSPIA